ncbi:MAG: hypothetical protein J0H12_01650 [Candidatus Paracaedimonas acanthamoebae]|uniref:Uncharacterized protein n=1 Tax=Candidatus Paracaedimonas acanthamoebae TaxID=244581 RepID=A0A8J7PQE6_9PROT|nr:hypothetical protein [Candidatus Paracaedimonas acanthamoebae]
MQYKSKFLAFLVFCLIIFMGSQFTRLNFYKNTETGFVQIIPEEIHYINMIGGHESFPPYIGPSITKYNNSLYFMANYRNLYLLDLKNLVSKKIIIVGKDKIPNWRPTDVFYHPLSNKVYVANYTGNNILIFSIAKAEHPILILEQIIDGFKEPEGIYLSKDGKNMIVANYGAGEACFFEYEQKAWVLKWKKNGLPACHGCLILHNKVYVAGEGFLKCYDFDGQLLFNKNELFGQKFRFVTNVKSTLDEQKLLISDTASGYVFITTPDLQEIMYFGKNGPSLYNFNMPYSAFQFEENKIFVSCLYQDRLVVIDLKNLKGESLSFRRNNWEWMNKKVFPQFNTKLSNDSDNIMGLTPISLFDLTLSPAYASFVNADRSIRVFMSSYLNPLSDAYPHYWSSYAIDDNNILILSNSSTSGILYDRKTKYIEFVDMGSFDCWGYQDNIYTPYGIKKIQDFKFIKHQPSEFLKKLPFKNINEIENFLGFPKETLEKRYSQSLKSGFLSNKMKIQDFKIPPSQVLKVDLVELFIKYCLTYSNDKIQ